MNKNNNYKEKLENKCAIFGVPTASWTFSHHDSEEFQSTGLMM